MVINAGSELMMTVHKSEVVRDLFANFFFFFSAAQLADQCSYYLPQCQALGPFFFTPVSIVRRLL